jgi:hypothetical protein
MHERLETGFLEKNVPAWEQILSKNPVSCPLYLIYPFSRQPICWCKSSQG